MTPKWLPHTITGKLVFLLAGLLLLQLVQFASVLHGLGTAGMEAGYINEAGRQRMRTLVMIHLANEAARQSGQQEAHRQQLRDEMASFEQAFTPFAQKAVQTGGETQTGVRQIWAAWQNTLKPLLEEVLATRSAAEARAAALAYEIEAVEQVGRIDRVVSGLELGVKDLTRRLIYLNELLLGLFLLLGVLAIFLARREIIGPVRDLVTASRIIEAGDYTHKTPVAGDRELGVLAETFNRMTSAIAANAERLTALNKLAVEFTSPQGLEALLDRALRSGCALTGAGGASIVFYDAVNERFTDWVTRGLSDHFVENLSFRRSGLADEAFTAGDYVISDDRPKTRHKLSALARHEGILGFICLPLISGRRRLGVLYFYRFDRDYFLPEEIDLLSTFSHMAAGAIDNARLYAETVDLAETDSLTGFHNRRMFDGRLSDEVRRAHRFGKPLSIMMLDLDHFKMVNDTYGHMAGDEVLKGVADLIGGQTREVDMVARYGGEEFVIILPETDGDGARVMAERIRSALESSPQYLQDGRAIPVTISIGICCYPRSAETAKQLVARADQALYGAKRGGRNQVCIYREMLRQELEQTPHRIVELLNESLDNVHAIVTAVDVKADFMRNHCEEVKGLAVRIGRALGLSLLDLEALRLASLLHDVGLIAVPDAILSKHEKLTPKERQIMQRHSAMGAELLAEVKGLQHIAPIVRHHHEHYDGSGYPDGLARDDIPFLAKVLAVADAYVAMTGRWPGRRPMEADAALAELVSKAGKQFDPKVTVAIQQIMTASPRARAAAQRPD